MSEYINKQEAIEAFSDMSDGIPVTHGDMISDTTAVNVIKSIPSADVRLNVHAHWESVGKAFQCSHCGTLCAVTETATHFIHHIGDKFCRGCGAMMDEEPKR